MGLSDSVATLIKEESEQKTTERQIPGDKEVGEDGLGYILKSEENGRSIKMKIENDRETGELRAKVEPNEKQRPITLLVRQDSASDFDSSNQSTIKETTE